MWIWQFRVVNDFIELTRVHAGGVEGLGGGRRIAVVLVDRRLKNLEPIQ